MENHKVNPQAEILRDLPKFKKQRSIMQWSMCPPKREEVNKRYLSEQQRLQLTLERHKHLKPIKFMNPEEIQKAVNFLDSKSSDAQLGKFTCAEWREVFQKELLYRELCSEIILKTFSKNNLIFCSFRKGEFKILTENLTNTTNTSNKTFIQEPKVLVA